MTQPIARLGYSEFRALAGGTASGLLAAGSSTAEHLPRGLVELVKLRASLLNGCRFCITMHEAQLVSAGETAERLSALRVGSDSPLFDARERAALALAEAATRLIQGPVPDAVYEAARAHFSPRELCALVSTIAVINAWNRIAVSFEFPEADALPKAGK